MDKHDGPGVTVDFAVDDDPFVVEDCGGYLVESFGGDPRDEELLRVAQAIVDASPL